MLNECRQALRVTTTAYDGEIMLLLQAGARDLEIAGVRVPGRVAWTVEDEQVNDLSTVKDPLVLRAIFTYVTAHFGNPQNYDRLAEAYENQKVQLMHAQDYTDYEATGGDCE